MESGNTAYCRGDRAIYLSTAGSQKANGFADTTLIHSTHVESITPHTGQKHGRQIQAAGL